MQLDGAFHDVPRRAEHVLQVAAHHGHHTLAIYDRSKSQQTLRAFEERCLT
jgi:hypothetical protein